ncbi:collagen-like triple helix repeat-containing protein [Spirosoma fluviale]|uniref:Collagen triple helix repeat-containing protein n=1 Tax=Spirosoma fluviale TaxID=1597977 RepID=A0A286G2E4_9BACT|nr:collagen-like protein [Spirosoma fluviale]SOD89691.1 Collagen triple helix repeat-containing protein [Spirosoma fluviale]
MKFTATFTNFFAPLLMGLTIIAFLASCKGEVGPKGDPGAPGVGTAGPAGATGATGATGPAGASGVAGATGATGPTGAQGVAGVSGTSSVTQVTYATSFTLANDIYKTYYFDLPSYISKAVVDKSIVLVYMQFSENPDYVYQISGPTFYGDEFIYLTFSSNNSSGIVQSIAIKRSKGTFFKAVTKVRVLIIPAANLVNGRKAAVDHSNYEAVKEYYDLKE